MSEVELLIANGQGFCYISYFLRNADKISAKLPYSIENLKIIDKNQAVLPRTLENLFEQNFCKPFNTIKVLQKSGNAFTQYWFTGPQHQKAKLLKTNSRLPIFYFRQGFAILPGLCELKKEEYLEASHKQAEFQKIQWKMKGRRVVFALDLKMPFNRKCRLMLSRM